MLRTQHVLRSSILVILIFGLNKVTGFVKLLLITEAFGTGPQADAFSSANQLPELFFALMAGGAIGSVLIPIYSAHLTKGEHAKATELANTVLTITLIGFGGVCLIAAVFAPWITRVLLVPDFPPEQQALTANLMRIILFASAIFAVNSIFSNLLNAHQHFLAPAWGTVVIDVGQIIGLYFLTPSMDIDGAAWGSVIGAVLYFCVQIPALVKHRIGYRPKLSFRMPSVHELGFLVWPRVITLGAYQAVDLVFIRLASQLPDGSISAYFYAFLIFVAMPKSLFGSAITNVIFPTLVEQFNEGRGTNLRYATTQALRVIWILIIPSAIGFVVLGQPAVEFLLLRGSFDAEAATLVYALMVIFALRLISEASLDVLYLPFFASHDTRTPMYATLGWMILNIGLSILLVGPFGIRGLAWATSISAFILAVGLFLLCRRMIGSLDEGLLRQTLGHIGLACAAMSVAIIVIRGMGLSQLSYLVTGITLGALVYIGVYFVFGGKEIMNAWRLIRSRQQPVEPAVKIGE